MMGAAGWIVQSMDVSHDLAAFLPDRDRPIESLLLSKADQGAVSRTVLAGFSGGSLEQRLAASRDAREALLGLLGITQVANGANNQDRQAFEPLFAYRYLLSESLSFDTQTLETALETRLRELRSPLAGMVKQALGSDPTAAFRSLLFGWSNAEQAPDREQGLWVSPDRERALLLATIDEDDFDKGTDARVGDAIRRALQEVANRHDADLLLAGRPILVAEARESIQSSLFYGSIVAGGLVLLLLLSVYRSVAVVFLGALPIMSGILAGLLAVLVIFGPVHGIALAFGITLLGIAIDYPLHLFSHGRADEPLAITARHLQRPVMLGALTTAGMFAIFGTGSAPGLGQLACFAGVGVLAAALTLRFVVPSLGALLKVRLSPRLVDILPAAAPKMLRGLVMVAVLAAITLLMLRSDRLFEGDVSVLNPLPEVSKRLDQSLRNDLGAPDLRHFFLIDGDSAEAVLRHAETLTPSLNSLLEAGSITDFDTPSRYLPSEAEQIRRKKALPGSEELASALGEASKKFPFKADLFSPFLQAIDESRVSTPLTGEAGLNLFKQTPLGAKLDQLLLSHGGRWYGFVPLSGMVDKTSLKELADGQDAVELVDLKSLSERILAEFHNEAFLLLLLGFGAIMLLLLVFRYPNTGILKIVSVLVCAMIVTTALLSLAGERLTMLHILSGLLVVGLGLDYTIFFSWPDADREQRRRTRHALLVCLISTAIVFGLLAFSSIDLLRAIGLTVALGACTTFVIAYAILSRPYEKL